MVPRSLGWSPPSRPMQTCARGPPIPSPLMQFGMNTAFNAVRGPTRSGFFPNEHHLPPFLKQRVSYQNPLWGSCFAGALSMGRLHLGTSLLACPILPAELGPSSSFGTLPGWRGQQAPSKRGLRELQALLVPTYRTLSASASTSPLL